MKLFEEAKGARVLAFGAHPDDIEVGTGGLVARLAQLGAHVVMAIASVPSQIEVRLVEAAEGARSLGARLVVLHDEGQRRVEDIPMHELVRRFDMIVGDVQPDLVITHSKDDMHWDHSLVNRAAISALRRTPCDLLAFRSSYEMNAQWRALGECFADVTDTMDLKLAAISAHKSQLAKIDLDSTRDVARAMGRICGVRYAEVFEVLRIRI